jgi:hypothetical protein
MQAPLCVGVAAGHDRLEVAVRRPGQSPELLLFPSGALGVEALKQYLGNFNLPVRLAVAGAAALNTALALAHVPLREIFIVSSRHLTQAAQLVRYAENAL